MVPSWICFRYIMMGTPRIRSTFCITSWHTHMHTHTHRIGIKILPRSSHYDSLVMNLTSIHEGLGSVPGPSQWVKGSGIFISCGVGGRHSLDLALLCLWCRLAATTPIWALPWEFPYTVGSALKETPKKIVPPNNGSFYWISCTLLSILFQDSLILLEVSITFH